MKDLTVDELIEQLEEAKKISPLAGRYKICFSDEGPDGTITGITMDSNFSEVNLNVEYP